MQFSGYNFDFIIKGRKLTSIDSKELLNYGGMYTMHAVEFKARIKDGMIEIPAQYKDKLKEIVRVIILTDESETTTNLIDQLLASPLEVQDFKPLSRAKIYERN